MKKTILILGVFIFLFTLVITGCTAEEETHSFKSYNEAREYFIQNHPTKIDIGSVRFDPKHLLALRDQMGEGGELRFSTNWGGTIITQESTSLDLNEVKSFSLEHLTALLQLCPELKEIRMDNHNVKVDQMSTILEQYPEVEFIWRVPLDGRHAMASNVTAYSTFHEPNATHKLTSPKMENLKYVHNLQALDLGHNELTTLDWLQYCPNLEFLILGDNQIKDLTPIGNLKHLKYLELFMAPVQDLTPLANCTELIDLNLSTCSLITDLTPLDNLQHLERFWANLTRGITPESQAHFIELHPNTEVHFDGRHATSDGWREHERCKHYLWCLHNRQWIPFDEPLPGK